MPRLTTPYVGGVPILKLAIYGPGGETQVAGIVDSGASKSLLPKSVATVVGISETDLVPTRARSVGAGGTSFPTWESETALTARVLAMVPHEEPWGPTITLRPQFAEQTIPLFGRADLFKAFVITFESARDVFHLDY